MFDNEFELICHEEKIVHVFSLLVSPGKAAQISGNDVQAHRYGMKTISVFPLLCNLYTHTDVEDALQVQCDEIREDNELIDLGKG